MDAIILEIYRYVNMYKSTGNKGAREGERKRGLAREDWTNLN
jgi:hypothetical protein